MAADLTLSSKDRELLQKLYGLRGEDSVIIKKHHDKFEKLNKSKVTKEEAKKKLEDEINHLEIEKAKLKEQGDEFVKSFKPFSRDNYKVILDKLNIAFDPKEMVAKVEKEAPEQIALMEETLKKKQDEVEELGNQIHNDESDIKETNIELEQAEKDQNALNNLIESALEGNKEITASLVEELLKKLLFTDQEIEELATMIMIKQPKLSAFDDYYQKIKSPIEEQTEVNGKTIDQLINAEKIEEQADKKEEETVTETTTETVEDDIKEPIVDENGGQLESDSSELNPENIAASNGVDQITITNNLRILNDLEAEVSDTALADSDLSNKIDILYSKGKQSQDVKYALDVIAKLTLEELNNGIKKIEAAGLQLGDLPLDVLNDVDNYLENINVLTGHNVVPDSKELSEHSSSVAVIDSETYKTNLEMAALYELKCTKANNKIPFEIFAQTPKSFVGKMDQYIESEEQDVLRIGSELLAMDADYILSAINLCKTLDVEYKSTDKYKSIITMPQQLEKIIGKDEIPVTVPTQDENNKALKEIIESEECVDKLLEAQGKNEFYSSHVVDEATYSTFAKIVEDASASSDEDVAYVIADTKFSKKKFKRNLEWMLENVADASTKQIIMTALATDSNKTEEDLKKVAEALGFNLAMGGK